MYGGYFPMGLSLERIMTELDDVPFHADVFPAFLRENARRGPRPRPRLTSHTVQHIHRRTMSTIPNQSVEDRIELVAGEFWGTDPHDELAWLRANAPVWRDPRTGVWGVATYDLVKHVSTHPELFSSAEASAPTTGPRR